MLGGRRAARDGGLAPGRAGGPPPASPRGAPHRPPASLGGAATLLPPCSTWGGERGGGGLDRTVPPSPPRIPGGAARTALPPLHPSIRGAARTALPPLCPASLWAGEPVSSQPGNWSQFPWDPLRRVRQHPQALPPPPGGSCLQEEEAAPGGQAAKQLNNHSLFSGAQRPPRLVPQAVPRARDGSGRAGRTLPQLCSGPQPWPGGRVTPGL